MHTQVDAPKGGSMVAAVAEEPVAADPADAGGCDASSRRTSTCMVSPSCMPAAQMAQSSTASAQDHSTLGCVKRKGKSMQATALTQAADCLVVAADAAPEQQALELWCGLQAWLQHAMQLRHRRLRRVRAMQTMCGLRAL